MDEREVSVILFDGVCNLCNGAVNFVIRRDPHGHFRFAPLQSPAGQELSREHDLPAEQMDTFVLIKDGAVYTRSTEARRVARWLGTPWSMAYALRFVPTFIRDWVYDLVAKYRYQVFGKQEVCMVPTADVRERFLT